MQVMSGSLFESDKNAVEKRKAVREAKLQDPRKIELVCLKNRYGISSYTAYFDYYPRYDLFASREVQPAAGGRRV